MAQFDYYLNRQGTRGPQGIQGEQGFSPIITVATNTLSEYVLQIQTQNNTFLTANLREHKDDLGGTYIRYNRETGVMYAGDADVASQSQLGVVRFATATDIERETEDCVVSPANVADMIEAVDPSGDISDLQSRVTTLEGETESLGRSVSDNSLAISALQSSVSGLLANYVPKTRTINGYALSSNITLTANDVNAYSKSEADTLLAAKADVSDLPDMNNYYNTTQIDLMLNEKADISDIPTVPTNVSAFTNDAGYITSSALPTVGNGTITINQGGVQRGQFSVNQSGDTTINLTDGGGGGGGSYTEGNGIDITNDVISVVPDGTTIDFNTNGELKVVSAPTPSNMVTTDSTQTISGAKTFSSSVTAAGINSKDSATQFNIKGPTGQTYIKLKTDGLAEIGESSRALTLSGSAINTYRNSSTYTNIDSGNISTYALTSVPIATTSVLGGVIPDGTTITVDADGTIHGAYTYVLPTASTSTLGGVKVDGTTITIDNNGVISSSGGGGGSSYTAGTGIDISNDVISIDDTVVATQEDLNEKQDKLSPNPPLTITEYTKNNLEGLTYTVDNTGLLAAGVTDTSKSYYMSPSHANQLGSLFPSGNPTANYDNFWSCGYVDIPYTIGQVVGGGKGSAQNSFCSNIFLGKFVDNKFIPIMIERSLFLTDNTETYTKPSNTFIRRVVAASEVANLVESSSQYLDSPDETTRYYGSLCQLIDTGSAISVYFGRYNAFYEMSISDPTYYARLKEITHARIVPLDNKGSSASKPMIIDGIGLWNIDSHITASTFTTENALGTNLFDLSGVQSYNYLDLHIGAGLAVQNGNLVNTNPTAVTVDQTYDGTSTNAQSGVAIAGAGFLNNTATGSNSLTISGTATNRSYSINIGNSAVANSEGCIVMGCSANINATDCGRSIVIGTDARVYRTGKIGCTIIGSGASGLGYKSVAIGESSAASNRAVAIGSDATASAAYAIQLGSGTNGTANTLNVGLGYSANYQLLDNSGKIPDARLNSTVLLTSTGVSSTNIRTITKLTQAEYDALTTKDANTFYVIVAASS